ncbi:hypothetical protein Tco_0918191 [Tanacetum coccineum]
MVSQKMKSSEMTSIHNSSGLKPQCQMTSIHNSSGLKPQCQMQMTFEHSSSSLGHQCQMTSVHISSGLVLHQMTSDHNRLELRIQDYSNEQSSSKLVVRLGINPMIQPEPEDLPKDNPKLEIAVLRVILLVFTMKMEILFESTSNKLSVAFKMRHSMRMLVKDTRSQDGKDDKDNDKGSKSRSQSMKEQAYNKEQRERPRPHELNDKSNLIDLMKECHQ